MRTPAGLIGTSGPIERMVSHPHQPPPTYSPSVRQELTEYQAAKGVSVEKGQKKSCGSQKRGARRYSVSSLRRKKVHVRAGSMLSTETHRGQLMVRLDLPEVVR